MSTSNYLAGERGRAFRESNLHFEKGGRVHKTLRRLAERLDRLGIPYAVVGAMAMYFHGYERYTDDVDVVVSPEGMEAIREKLEGLGYRPAFAGARQLRDTETGVRIEFILTGHYPGDGKPKPVSFPNPRDVAVEIEGVKFVGLAKLVELKLASGTAPHRLKDLADVQEMIGVLKLPRELSDQLDPFVREKYVELWDAVENAPPDP